MGSKDISELIIPRGVTNITKQALSINRDGGKTVNRS